MGRASARTSVLRSKTLERAEFTSARSGEIRAPAKWIFCGKAASPDGWQRGFLSSFGNKEGPQRETADAAPRRGPFMGPAEAKIFQYPERRDEGRGPGVFRFRKEKKKISAMELFSTQVKYGKNQLQMCENREKQLKSKERKTNETRTFLAGKYRGRRTGSGNG